MSQNKEGLKISYHLEAYFKTCYGTFKEVGFISFISQNTSF